MALCSYFAFGTLESMQATKSVINTFALYSEGNRVHIDGPNLIGTDVVANANNAVTNIITSLRQSLDEINLINLVGFSRGAITTLYIANALQEEKDKLDKQAQQKQISEEDQILLHRLNNLQLNIFALDAVAGMGSKSNRQGRVIPKIVSNFVAFYQLDERRIDFKPQDMTRLIVEDPNKTQVALLPIYGNHSDALRIKEGRRTAAEIVWHTLHHFLKQDTAWEDHDNPPYIVNMNHEDEKLNRLDQQHWLELYSAHKEERKAYDHSGKTLNLLDGIPTSRKIRTINFHRPFYVKDSSFFTNSFERGMFKLTYPVVFNYLFEQNMKDERFPEQSHSDKDNVIAELKILAINNPKLFARLMTRGVKIEGEMITVGNPRGLYVLESCSTVNQVLPSFVKKTVEFERGNQSIKQLSDLEMEIYRLTFRYEREKPELQFFSDRSKSSSCVTLRKEILQIVDYSHKNAEEKYHDLLSVVEKHYQQLVRSNSASELRPMLKLLLRKHGYEYATSETDLFFEMLSHVVDVLFSVLKEALKFIANLGYIGTFICYPIGYAIESLGQRAIELIRNYTDSSFAEPVIFLLFFIEFIGSTIKNNFGLMPLFTALSDKVRDSRDYLISELRDVEFTPIEPKANPELPNAEDLIDLMPATSAS